VVRAATTERVYSISVASGGKARHIWESLGFDDGIGPHGVTRPWGALARRRGHLGNRGRRRRQFRKRLERADRRRRRRRAARPSHRRRRRAPPRPAPRRRLRRSCLAPASWSDRGDDAVLARPAAARCAHFGTRVPDVSCPITSPGAGTRLRPDHLATTDPPRIGLGAGEALLGDGGLGGVGREDAIGPGLELLDRGALDGGGDLARQRPEA